MGGTPIDGGEPQWVGEDPNGWGGTPMDGESHRVWGGPNGKDGRTQWMGTPWMDGGGGGGETRKGWEPPLGESPHGMDSAQRRPHRWGDLWREWRPNERGRPNAGESHGMVEEGGGGRDGTPPWMGSPQRRGSPTDERPRREGRPMDGTAPKWKREPHRRPTGGEGSSMGRDGRPQRMRDPGRAEEPLMMEQERPTDGQWADPWMGALLSDPQVLPPHLPTHPIPWAYTQGLTAPTPRTRPRLRVPSHPAPHTPHVRPQLYTHGTTNAPTQTQILTGRAIKSP